MPRYGTGQRIRNRTLWAVALFAAAVPPAFVSTGVAFGTTTLALRCRSPSIWALGVLFALAAAFPPCATGKHCRQAARWLGALPILSVALFFAAVLHRRSPDENRAEARLRGAAVVASARRGG